VIDFIKALFEAILGMLLVAAFVAVGCALWVLLPWYLAIPTTVAWPPLFGLLLAELP
jgi:hypothetical protein